MHHYIGCLSLIHGRLPGAPQPNMFSAFVDIAGDVAPNVGNKTQTIATLFGGNTDAYAAFDPSAVIARHSRYTAVSGWFDIPGTPQSQHRSITAAEIGVVTDGVHDSAANPEGQDVAANTPCALGSTHGIRCTVMTQPGRHDWPFAARAFAAALPWLAGRLGTPGVPRLPLPGLTPEALSPPRPSVAMPSAQAAGK